MVKRPTLTAVQGAALTVGTGYLVLGALAGAHTTGTGAS